MKTMANSRIEESFTPPAFEGVTAKSSFAFQPVDVVRKPRVATSLHLTPRQLEVLALLCEGLTNKHIGQRLNIASATVKIHISCILRELHVASRLQAVIAARRLALVTERAPVRARQPKPSLQLGRLALLSVI